MASYEYNDPDSYALAVDAHPAKRTRTQAGPMSSPSRSRTTRHSANGAGLDSPAGQLELNGGPHLAEHTQYDGSHLDDQHEHPVQGFASSKHHYDPVDGPDGHMNAEAGPSRTASLSAGPDSAFEADPHAQPDPPARPKGKPGRKEAAPDPTAAQARLDKIRLQGRERQRKKRERDRAKRDSGGTTTGSFDDANPSPSPSVNSTSSQRKRPATPSATPSTRSRSHPAAQPEQSNETSPSPGPSDSHLFNGATDDSSHPTSSAHPESASAAHQILSLSAALNLHQSNGTPGPSTSSSSAPTPNDGHPPSTHSHSRHPSGDAHHALHALHPVQPAYYPGQADHNGSISPSANGQHFATTLLHALQTNEGVMGHLRETLGLREEDLVKMGGGLGGVYDRFVADQVGGVVHGLGREEEG